MGFLLFVGLVAFINPGPLGLWLAGSLAVLTLLHELGHADVLDLGPLETARGAEMFVVLWVRTAMALGGSDFGIKVVRGPSLGTG
jgi:hypothetical protein